MMNASAKKSSSSALDKYTMQEKIVPLIRAIKTKEPAVATAALNVLRVVGGVADTDFVAMDILPVLWSMSLGPLLDLKQFQSFMDLIKCLSSRVEAEQTKKLQELSGTNGSRSKGNDDFMSFGATNAFANGGTDNGEIDFEQLVKGKAADGGSSNPLDSGWHAVPSTSNTRPQISNQPKPASFAWSTPSPTTTTFSSSSGMTALKPQQPVSRTITPDLARFDTLSPTKTQFSQPLQPQPFQPPSQSNYNPSSQMSNYNPTPLAPPPQPQSQPFQSFQSPPTTVNWGTAASNPWSSSAQSSSQFGNLGNSMGSMSLNQQQQPAMSTQHSYVNL